MHVLDAQSPALDLSNPIAARDAQPVLTLDADEPSHIHIVRPSRRQRALALLDPGELRRQALAASGDAAA